MDSKRLRQKLEEYEAEILPLRADADAGIGGYAAYDEAYNVWLESLHNLAREVVNYGNSR